MSDINLQMTIEEMLVLKGALNQEHAWLCEAMAVVGEGNHAHAGFAEKLRCVERLQEKLMQAFKER